jgi:peptidoglycan/LPS O-acetylase OafA/YrhL
MGKVFFMGRYAVDRPGILRFYKGRFLRIAPLLWVNLALCWLLLPTADPTPVEALGDFLFVNNYTGRDINGVTWSLSWEMQFYLLAPLVFAYFCRWSKTLLLQLVLLAVTFEILAWFGIKEFPPTEFLFYFLIGFGVNHALRHVHAHKFAGATVLAFVLFFVGNAVYYAIENSGAEALANPFIGVVAAVVIYLIELPRPDEGAIAAEPRYAPPALLALRFWTWMGMLSYGIYLWHLPILELIDGSTVDVASFIIGGLGLEDTGWQRVVVFHATQVPIVVGLTLVVSLTTFLLVETRFRPNLYRWDSSRYVLRHLGPLAAQLNRTTARSRPARAG